MKTNRNQKWATLAFVPLLAIAQCAYAQDTSTNNTQITITNNTQNALGQVAPANHVFGHEVMSSDNQRIGKLNNLVVDLESGRILYG
ncbi:MAG: PRC-barrel domain-containing protein, partial [Candidatus Dormibacteraceae bacterium]